MSETLNITNLGTQVIDQGEGEYEAPSEFYRPPDPTPKGERTTLVLVEPPADGKFYPMRDWDTGETIPGFSVNLHFKIQGGVQDDREFYTLIDTRKNQRNSSMVKDYLLGMGYTGRLVTVEDFKTAVQTFIAPVQTKLTWTGEKCETCARRTVKKLADFTLRADGSRRHVTKCPDCGEDVGARVKIVMFFVTTPTPIEDDDIPL